jgi:hypothetical protein
MTERENRVGRRAAIFTTLTVVALMTACAGAQAKTFTIGSPLTGSFTPVQIGLWPPSPPSCPCYIGSEIGPRQANDGMVTVPLTLVPPPPYPGGTGESLVDGTVISYRVAAAEGTFAIQVVRLTGSRGRSIVSSTPRHITSTGVSAPIATRLAIRGESGETVGIRNFGEGDQLGLGWSVSGGFVSGGSVSAWAPPLVDGAPARSRLGSYYDEPYSGYEYQPSWGEIGMQATVRFCRLPNVEGKSLAVARKILTRADCRVGKLTQTNHVRDKREVIFQSVQAGFAVSDTKPIKLWLSRGPS